VLAGITGCTLNTPASTGSAGAFGGPYKKNIQMVFFSSPGNYQGVQKGWFGHLVTQKFNMSLNFVAPNVAGGGDTLYNTRVAAGNLGDLIIVPTGQKFDQLVQGGLLYDMSSVYSKMTNIKKYDAAVQNLNKGKKGTWAIPAQVTALKPTEPSEGLDPSFGAYLRWDYYKELGYPQMSTLEDVIPVLKEMQQKHPKAGDGKTTYGFSLFKDWDGGMMTMAMQLPRMYGYDVINNGFVFAKADGSDYQDIMDSNSLYIRALRMYCTANQQGLVDPDSPTQNYSTMFTKYQNGQILFGFWPWLVKPSFNTTQNLSAGKGFQLSPVGDQNIFSYGNSPYGGGWVFGIGSKAAEPERAAAFLDWLYSPDGISANNGAISASAGPEGLTWQLGSDKKPELTDLGQKALLSGGATLPASWGGGTFVDGESQINAQGVTNVDIDPQTGLPYNYEFWPSVQKLMSNPVIADWQTKMGGATSDIGYLQKNNQLLVAPGTGYAPPADSPQISTIRGQARQIIIQNSWKMSLSTSDSQFNSLLKEMQTTVKGLGYDQVVKADMEYAKAQNDLRISVAKKFA